jgi:small subunit ribosomal protein S14
MAKTNMIARDTKRKRLVELHAAKREELKKAGDWTALQKLPKNSCKTRMRNRCKLTGRPRGYMRDFGISRVTFREMVLFGLIPGVTKSSF